MSITDRTRKLLWARSGNHCAICKTFLVVEGATEGEAAILGEECHIVAQSSEGPRGSADRLDDIDGCYNLILLCANDHTLIDGLSEEYTVERLLLIKKTHEKWLADLDAPPHLPQIRIRPASDETATWLSSVGSAREIIDTVYHCCAADFQNDLIENDWEADLIGAFLQEVEDLDILDGLGIRHRVQAEFRLDELLSEVKEAGFLVYAGKVQRTLEVNGIPRAWPVAIVRVLRANNPTIQPVTSSH